MFEKHNLCFEKNLNRWFYFLIHHRADQYRYTQCTLKYLLTNML